MISGKKTLKKFLRLKGNKAITNLQAELFGVPQRPMQRGWIQKYGGNNVDDETWNKLLTTLKGGDLKHRQYLYVISNPDNKWKIGISHNVNKRLGALQSSNPDKLTLLAVYTSDVFAKTMEQEAHKAFKKFHISGEWFDGNKLSLTRLEALFPPEDNLIRML
jgi:predicted GIY-YIG superfamily endonuclease